jgi:hypothetical protein
LSLAAGLHRQSAPPGVYFIQLLNNDSNAVYQPNRDLDLMQSVHLVFSYDFLISKQLRLHAEAYYQKLRDVPAAGNFWLSNEIEGYPARALRSEGEGQNRGVDFSLEKFFRQGAFFILNGSLFESVWENGGEAHPTQFDARYAASLTLGKEWAFAKGGVFQAGMKNIILGGLPATPLAAVQLSGERETLDYQRPFSERIGAYWRTDLRLAWRKGKTALSLDVQNLLNRENLRPFGWEYDLRTKQWTRRTQAGWTPVLSFTLDF